MKPWQREVKIAYLVKTFPKVSETFILREILALESAGLDLQIFALRRPQEDKAHAITSQVRAQVVYAPARFSDDPIGLLTAHLTLLLTHPWRYCRALCFAVRHRAAGSLTDFLQAAYVAWLLLRLDVSHLHAHFINQPAGIAELVHHLIALPYSITAHAKDIYLSPPPVLARKMAGAQFVVTCNEYNRGFLQEHAPKGTSIVRSYHGLDLQLFQPDPQAASGEDLPMLLSVGRFREKKGFVCLLDACHLLKTGGYRFQCVIVGYGPLREELTRRITELDLDDVVSLTGMLTQDDVIRLYKRATLFALPCQITDGGDRDGIPNVLVEAMAMELPVVSTHVSGIPELVEHMRNGILVRPQDPAGLATAMAQLLDQPQLRRALGMAGRQKVYEQFSAQRNALQLKALFTQMPVALAEDIQADAQVVHMDDVDASVLKYGA